MPLVSDESLVELCRGRTRGSKGRAVSNKGAASGCCSTHQPSNYFAVSPPNVLARLDEGCFAPKTNPPASALLLVSCDASCLYRPGVVAIQLQRDHSVLRKFSSRTCCRRAANFGHRCGTFKPVLRQCSLKLHFCTRHTEQPALRTSHALHCHFDASSRLRPVTLGCRL